jgi:hypothetical protein
MQQTAELSRVPAGVQVQAHFLERGAWMVQSCRRYLAGEAVCSLPAFPGTSAASPDAQAESCSDGFKLMLNKIVPKLEEAFVKLGCKLV